MCLIVYGTEKSGNGHEEGKRKGPDHDDIGFAGAVHFPLYLGILHLVIESNPVNTLFVHEKDLKLLRRRKINGTFNMV